MADTAQALDLWPFGGGEMAGLVRAADWAATPLGDPAHWSCELRCAVELMLASPTMATLVVGPARILLYNDAAAAQYGDRHPAALGRPVAETWPEAWGQAGGYYERVFAGESVQVPAEPLDLERAGAGQVFDAYLTPVRARDGSVIAGQMLGFEVGAKLRAEAVLKASEERQAFLLQLSDALRPVGDADVITQTACRMLAAQLDASRVQYTRVHGEPGTEWGTVSGEHIRVGPPMPDRYDLADFGETVIASIRRGEVLVIDDLERDARLAAAEREAHRAVASVAAIAVPLVKEGRLVAVLTAHATGPRTWSASQVEMTKEVAERTWAAVERANAQEALRQIEADRRGDLEREIAARTAELAVSRDFLQTTIDSSTDMIQVFQAVRDPHGCIVDFRWRLNNRAAELVFGHVLGQSLLQHNPGLKAEGIFDAFKRVVEFDAPEQWERHYAHEQFNGWFYQSVVKLDDGVATTIKDISPWKAAQAALLRMQDDAAKATLRQSEQRLAAAFRMLPVGMSIIDANGDTMMTNQVMRRFLPTDVLPSRDAGRVERWRGQDREGRAVVPADFPAARALRGETVSPGLQMIFRDDDDREIWTEVLSAPLKDDNGQITGAMVVVVDVDRTKRSEEAARASEDRLRAFGEASQDILWIRDADTLQWQYLTPAFERIYGMSRDEALAGDNWRNWEALIVPEDRARAVANIERVRGGESVTFEYRIRRPVDGALRWLRNNDFPMRDATGRVIRIAGVGEDVTELKRTQELVAASEERLRTLVEGVPQLVWRATADGDWTWASAHWVAATGQTEAEYRGQGWLDALHPDDRAAARAAWSQAADGGFAAEYRIGRHGGGEYRWFKAGASPVRDAAGSVLEWLGIATDVDELRRLQERQKTLLAELQHRVRNILALTRSIVSRSDDGERTAEDYVHHLQGRISALARTQVLLTRRTGSGVDLQDLIRDELLAQVASEHQFALDGPDVDLSPKAAEVLTLAVHELATNATKYGAFARDSGRLQIEWEVEERGGRSWLLLDWVERGVPIVDAAPRRRGFGAELVSRRIPYELKGVGTFELRPGGLHSRIEFPLADGASILQTDGAAA